MSTPSELPGASAQVSVGLAAPVARAVAEDLAAIFPNEPPTSAANALRRGRRPATTTKRPSGGRAATIGALAAAVLVGVSAGALFGRQEPAPARPAPQSGIQLVATADSLPSPGPLPAGPLHSPASIQTAATTPVTPAKVRKTSRPAARHGRAQAQPAKSCRGDDCGAASVKAADARLQRAYSRAEQAGVPAAELDAYHERWSKLDPEASRKPGMVTASYDAMTVDLNRLAAQHRAEPEPRRHTPARGLRSQMAALWR